MVAMHSILVALVASVGGVSAKSSVTAVSHAGGGFRALSASIGFTKAMEETGLMKSVSLMSSNSGGSWFSALYNYDSDFYGNVVNGKIAAYNATEEFLLKYLEASKCKHSWFECMKIYGVAEVIDEVLPNFISPFLLAFVNGHVVVHALELGWEGLVDQILGGIGSITASGANRTVQENPPDLLFFTTMPTKDIIVNYTTRNASVSSSSGTPLPGDLAIAFAVTGSSTEIFSPSVPANTLNIALPDGTPGPVAFAKDPTFGAMAGASSSLPGSFVSEVIDLSIADVISFKDRADLAVCTAPGKCHLPDARLVDGGMVDNTAVAAMIAKLQRQHGLDITPRVFALDSVNMDLFALFGHTSMLGSNASHIFGGNVSHHDFVAHGSIEYFHRTVQTITNTRFGVQGGQSIDLFVVLATNNCCQGVMISSSEDAAAMAKLSQDVYKDSLEILKIVTMETSMQRPVIFA